MEGSFSSLGQTSPGHFSGVPCEHFAARQPGARLSSCLLPAPCLWQQTQGPGAPELLLLCTAFCLHGKLIFFFKHEV